MEIRSLKELQFLSCELSILLFSLPSVIDVCSAQTKVCMVQKWLIKVQSWFQWQPSFLHPSPLCLSLLPGIPVLLLIPQHFLCLKFSIIILITFFQSTCLSALLRSLFFQILAENFPLSSHCPGAAGTVLSYQHKRHMFSILLFEEMAALEFWVARIGREALLHPYTLDCKVHSLGGIVK